VTKHSVTFVKSAFKTQKKAEPKSNLRLKITLILKTTLKMKITLTLTSNLGAKDNAKH